MKRARVAYAGSIHHAVSEDSGLRLIDGRFVSEDSVVWLPPVVPGIVLALGLNYAGHAKELKFEAPSEPLAFPQSRRYTRRSPRPNAPSRWRCFHALRM